MRKQRYKGQNKLPSDTETDKEALMFGSGVLALHSPLQCGSVWLLATPAAWLFQESIACFPQKCS